MSFIVAVILGGAAANAQAPQQVTEPKDAGIFYLLDPSAKLLSLEFQTVQKQASALQVKGDHSQVRFPVGTTFRFVARLDAGTQINFFKSAVDKGYRVVPLTISNRRLVIKPDSGAETVHFDTAVYGSASMIVTPKDALGPGEYCLGAAAGHDSYCFGVDAAEPVATQSPSPAQNDAPMTNADVIKLARAGISEDVIIGSINHATRRNFDLSVNGLLDLKSAHVPDAVLSAMNRASDAAVPVGPPAGGPLQTPPVPDAQIQEPPVTGVFYLVAAGGALRKLEPIRPTITQQQRDLFEGNQVFYKVFGAHSPVRVTNPNVALVIKLVPKDNKFHALGDNAVHDLNNMYYRRFESLEGARQTMVSAKNQRRGQHHDPDPGEFEFSITKLGADFYKVVSNEPLISGEYCVDDSLFTNITPIFCFGVDAPR